MIENSVLLTESISSTPPPNSNVSSKAYSIADLPSKTSKRRNQPDLGYFNSHLDKANDKGKIVLVSKDVYYKNIVLFIQYLQSLVTFKGAIFVKANITMSL